MNDYDSGSAPPSEPPEDAYVRSEPHLLSPASPKPIHFPQPTNIPVLENMMDVGYNQTEAHMSDPAMRNTELRPGAWRDPNEPAEETTDYASPFSTGGGDISHTASADKAHPTTFEATKTDEDGEASALEPGPASIDAHSSTETLANEADVPLASQSNGFSYQANSHLQTDVVPETHHAIADTSLPSSNPSVPAAEQTAPTADASLTQPTENDQAQANATATPHPLSDEVVSAQHTSQAEAQAPAHGTIPSSQPAMPSQPEVQTSVHGALPSSPLSAPGLGAGPSGLPPRPPPQEQPRINPNYVHSQHISDFHPISQVPQSMQPSFPATNMPIESRREYKIAAGETPTIDDQPWTQDIQRKYDHFLDEERRYVNEAKWDQFPLGSRLFVGNLSSEKVTKRDIFHVFHSYGDLAQVSIKQAYGFVQFLKADDCARALVSEQGRQISDKRIHLEVSKPQKAARNQQNNARRSRSPDHGGRGKRGQDGDRYSHGRGGTQGRNRESRDLRDGYRPGHRSPSPRGYRERRDERFSTRSRSPAYGHRDRDRYTRASPRRESEDDLPLPRRMPQDVPDVQLIILDQLERDFIAWVEAEFSKRGIRIDTLMISPRLSEEAVVRRQILEGVLAVSRLRRHNQNESKIGLTIFKRKGALQDVQFEEYERLDPNVACELVLREKRTLQGPAPSSAASYGNGYSGQGQYGGPPPPQQYGYQQQQQQHAPYGSSAVGPPAGFQQNYGQQTAYSQQPPGGYPNNGPPHPTPPNVDPNNLQNLLANLGQPPAPYGGPPAPAPYGMPSQQPGYPPQPPAQQGYPPQPQQQGYAQQGRQYNAPQQNPGAGYQSYSATPVMPGSHPGPSPPNYQQPPTGQSPANMKDVLARLGSYVP